MKKLATFIVKHKLVFLIVFAVLAIGFGVCIPFVGVNYDSAAYLPESSETKQGLSILHEEFGENGTVSVMAKDVSLAEAYELKTQIAAVSGVKSVLWLDEAALAMKPDGITLETFWKLLETMLPSLPADQQAQFTTFYKDGNALFQVTMTGTDYDRATSAALDEIRALNGGAVHYTGPSATAHNNVNVTMKQTATAMLILIPIILVILFLATTSFWEPLLFVAVIAVSIVINMGSNIVMGEISYLTQAVAAILQLALTMDYTIFLLSRFKQEKARGASPQEAMITALTKSFSPVSASSLTTVAGFVALMFMRYTIGLDMGIVLAKGIILSLLSVFLLMPALVLYTHKLLVKTTHRELTVPFGGFGKVIKKSRFILPVLLLALIIPSFIFQNQNTYTYGDEASMGSKGSALQQDKAEIEETFGHLNNLVVLVPRTLYDRELALTTRLMGLTDYVASAQSDSLIRAMGVDVPDSMLAQFNGENYTRIVLNLSTPEEGEEATAAVAAIREAVAEIMPEGGVYLVGGSSSALDIKNIAGKDFQLVNLLSILFVALILAVTFRSLLLPVILVLVIQSSIWMNMAIPYLMGQPIVFIGYMIVSCIQLGATIDYGILLSNRYLENRRTMNKFDACIAAIKQSGQAILTSAGILCAAGFTIGLATSMPAVSVLGMAIGRGALTSLGLVLILLPELLILLDAPIRYTMIGGRKNMIPNRPAPPDGPAAGSGTPQPTDAEKSADAPAGSK